ncbi:2-C-methyl-D-erythritol 4-phosphate cytidylyltransferase [Prauserella sediminis]|uniref:2-C-methyl-D-erythritol 4-phosphate cytidylyltransferase n=1 Tax=Prauserella sediminis TaxID=577680 RepID=A0A839XPD9_9PSEU|nr:2-C-methyl-D-erythritol 4-phosphate cytidylyltransferase [Prauserella sediminis]
MSHAVHGLLDSGCVDRIVVAGPARHRASYPSLTCDGDRVVFAAEPTQADSAKGANSGDHALRSALSTAAPGPDDVVLVHDATRAFVPASVVSAVVDAVRDGAAGAVPVEPVADTVKVVDTEGIVHGTRDRSLLRHAQAPVAVRADVLAELLTGDAGPTDAAELITRLDGRARPVPGDPHGMGVHTPFDVAVIEALLSTENTA